MALLSAIMAANGATVVLFVNEPIFDALPAKCVLAGASNLPNLHHIMNT